MVAILLAGAFGGLLRGIVGFIKYQFAYKNIKFEPQYVATIMALSAVTGLSVTWAFSNSGLVVLEIPQVNPALALIIGYAGGDFLENIYKIIIGKTTLYPLPKK
jgi:hypothetical protein